MSQEMNRPLEQKLASTRVWWRTTRALAGAGLIAAVVVALGLVCYHLDRWLALSAPARIAWLWTIGMAALVTLLLALLRPVLRRLPDAMLAAEVEKQYPVLKERLLTTINLTPALAAAGSGAMPSGFSRAMTGALAEETQRVAADLNFRRAVDTRPMRRALLLALLLLGVGIADRAANPAAFDNWLNRMRYPAADIPPWALTRVWVKPSAELVPTGEGVAITIETRGIVAEKATLKYRLESENDWKTIELTKAVVIDEPAVKDGHANAVRHFSYKFPSLSQTVYLQANANDGRSNERTVTVEERPTLLNFQMRMHYPAYMHRADETLPAPTPQNREAYGTDGTITAPVGTEVIVRAIANKPLRTAEFMRDGKDIGPWAVTNDRHVEGQLSVWQNGKYSLHLRDRHNFNNPLAAVYEIRAIEDKTPDVQITQPTADVELVPDGSIPLNAMATDDHGIVRMGLEYNRTMTDNTGVKSTVKQVGQGGLPLLEPNDPQIGGTQIKIGVRWNLSSVAPQPGETVRFTVSATDADNLRGPHTGRATTYSIRVVSLLQMQAKLKNMQQEEDRLLAQLRQRQMEAQRQLEMARLKGDPTNISKAEELERSVAQDARTTAQRVADLSAQLENNNFATPSELKRRDEGQKVLEDTAQQRLPAAADAVKSAQDTKPKSGQRSTAFNKAGQQEAEGRRDIEKAQELLSRVPPPEQLAAEAKRLALEQRQQADASRYIAENTPRNQLKKGDNALPPEMKVGMQMERKHQADLNADTKRLEDQLNRAAQAAKERGNAAEAAALKRAADALKQGQTQAQQAQAQSELQKNSPADAAPPQDKAANALDKAAQAAQEAANPNNDSPEAAAQRLEAAAQRLRDLAAQQREAAKQIKQNPNSAQSKALAGKEKDIANKAADEQQNLQAAQGAQQSLQSAEQNLDKSGEKLSQDNSQAAQSPAEKAAQQLEKAAQQAANAANNIKQQQAASELAEKVARLAQDQRALQAATKRLNEAKQRGALSSNDLRELGQVQARQKSTEQKAQDLAQRFPSAAFQKALDLASKQMDPATKNLDKDNPDTGKDTQTAQGRAAQTLETVAQALKAQAQGPSKPGNQNAKQGPDSPQEAQQFAALGQLKLAQGLQNQVQSDTGKLDKSRPNDPVTKAPKPLTPEQGQEAGRLAQGQQDTKDIAKSAGEELSDLPGVGKSVGEATQQMGEAKDKLGNQQTGRPTQTNQENASQKLAQAVKQAEKAIQEQQQQKMAQGNGGPRPGSQPDRKGLTRIQGVKNGKRSSPNGQDGSMGAFNQRTQRALREGQSEDAGAEYRALVEQYYKSLSAKKH